MATAPYCVVDMPDIIPRVHGPATLLLNALISKLYTLF